MGGRGRERAAAVGACAAEKGVVKRVCGPGRTARSPQEGACSDDGTVKGVVNGVVKRCVRRMRAAGPGGARGPTGPGRARF